MDMTREVPKDPKENTVCGSEQANRETVAGAAKQALAIGDALDAQAHNGSDGVSAETDTEQLPDNEPQGGEQICGSGYLAGRYPEAGRVLVASLAEVACSAVECTGSTARHGRTRAGLHCSLRCARYFSIYR